MVKIPDSNLPISISSLHDPKRADENENDIIKRKDKGEEKKRKSIGDILVSKYSTAVSPQSWMGWDGLGWEEKQVMFTCITSRQQNKTIHVCRVADLRWCYKYMYQCHPAAWAAPASFGVDTRNPDLLSLRLSYSLELLSNSP